MKDKNLLKFAGILGIILGIISCFTIVGVLWGIPMIIGGDKLNSYSKMEDDEIIKYKDSIFGWSVFFLIFFIISGVLGFIYYIGLTDEERKKENNDYMDQLEKLKKLYDDKVLTKEEYEEKKQKILEKI